MTLFLAIRRLLAVVMVAGLVLAPLARPAMAGATSAAPMAMHGMSAHGTMAEDVSMQGMDAHNVAIHSIAGHAMSGHASAPMDELSASSDVMAAMPCCPSEAPQAPVDCGKCLTMAGCSVNFLSGMPGTVAVPLPIPTKGVALASADFARDGLGHPPPEYPPRSLV